MKVLTIFLLLLWGHGILFAVQPCYAFTTTTTTTSTCGTHRLAYQTSLFPPSAKPTATSLQAVTSYDDECDVLVLGSGPAGCAIASLLGAKGGLDVVVANKDFDISQDTKHKKH